MIRYVPESLRRTDRVSARVTGSDQSLQLREWLRQNLLIQEQKGRQRLVLRRGRDAGIHCEV
jgi:hypothetical protein